MIENSEIVKDIFIEKNESVNDLLKKMEKSGGFTSKKLAIATNILENMLKDKSCFKFLSFPACIVSTGTRGIIIDMIKNGFVDAIITTSGTIDHDLARTWDNYYHGDFSMDDIQLKKKNISRLGNVLVPISCYTNLLEKKLIPLLDEIYSQSETKSLSTQDLTYLLGSKLNDENSLLYWAFKKNIPIFIPGITDGAFGCQLWMYYQKNKKISVDLLKDFQSLFFLSTKSKKTGGLIIGGGISKHHLILHNTFKGGLDYAIYLTTAQEYDGSLSGAKTNEAISWGKINEKSSHITVEGDATISFPLIFSGVMSRINSNI